MPRRATNNGQASIVTGALRPREREQDERVAVLLASRGHAPRHQTSSNRILMPVLLRLPTGRSRLLQHDPATATVAGILSSLEDLEGLPSKAVRLVHEGRELTRAAQYESPFFGGRAAAVTIDVTAAQVTVAGGAVTINPTAALTAGKQ